MLNVLASVSPSVESLSYCIRQTVTGGVSVEPRRRGTDAVRLTVVSVSLITDTLRGISGTAAPSHKYEHLYLPEYGRQKTEKLCTTDDKIQAK